MFTLNKIIKQRKQFKSISDIVQIESISISTNFKPEKNENPKRNRRVSFQVNNSHFFNTTPKNALDLLRLQYSDAEDDANDADNEMEFEETNQPQLSVRDAWQWKAGADEVKHANKAPQSSNLSRRNLNSTLKLKRKKITKSKCCIF